MIVREFLPQKIQLHFIPIVLGQEHRLCGTFSRCQSQRTGSTTYLLKSQSQAQFLGVLVLLSFSNGKQDRIFHLTLA